MSKTGFVVLFIIALVGCSFGIYNFIGKTKTGFIIIEEVYSKFDFKKELEKKFMDVKFSRKKILDSLELDLKLLNLKLQKQTKIFNLEAEGFEKSRQFYLQMAKQTEEDNSQLSSQYDKEILIQLNQYMKDYGEENNYDYIFGSNNNGSLMYSKEINNVTQEAIRYINSKYNGLK